MSRSISLMLPKHVELALDDRTYYGAVILMEEMYAATTARSQFGPLFEELLIRYWCSIEQAL